MCVQFAFFLSFTAAHCFVYLLNVFVGKGSIALRVQYKHSVYAITVTYHNKMRDEWRNGDDAFTTCMYWWKKLISSSHDRHAAIQVKVIQQQQQQHVEEKLL